MLSINTSFISELRSEWRSLKTAQKWLYFLYAILLINLLFPFFRAFEGLIGLRVLQPYSNTIFLFAAVVGCFPILRKKIKGRDVLLLLALVVFHHISAVTHVGTALYAGRNASRFIFSCLPLFLVGLSVDKQISPKLLVGMSYLALLIQILYLYVFGVSINKVGEAESMSASYNLLPFVCFLTWNAFRRGGFWHVFIATIGAFVLVSLGTRGPLVCYAFFVVIYLFLFKRFKYDKISKMLIGAAAVIIYIFSFEITFFFASLSSQLGLSTRVYDSILEEQLIDIEESNGRDELWGKVLKTLRDNKIYFDANLYADRLYTGFDSYYDLDRTVSGNDIDSYNANIYNEEEVNRDDLDDDRVRRGWYVHNLELELLCDFGLVGGLMVILLLFWLIIKAFRLTWKTNTTILLLVFFTASIMQLQFSNSYLRAPIFWFFMGMCVTLIRGAMKNR